MTGNSTAMTRERVLEWRITTHAGRALPFVVRWWIEADPEFGGLPTWALAVDAVRKAERELETARNIPSLIAAALLEAVPAANSVEVCDAAGNGAAVHRDWP